MVFHSDEVPCYARGRATLQFTLGQMADRSALQSTNSVDDIMGDGYTLPLAVEAGDLADLGEMCREKIVTVSTHLGNVKGCLCEQ